MKNFIKSFLIMLLILLIFSCADIDRNSEKIVNSNTKNLNELQRTYHVNLEYFEELNDFEQKKFNEANNNKSGSDSLFLVKYDSLGTKMWSKNFGEKDDKGGISMSEDFLGNIYLVTYLELEKNFEDKPNLYNVFLKKYNALGIFLWEKKIGVSFSNDGMGIIVDSYNNIYVTGFFNGNVFLKKYDSSGYKQWEEKIGFLESKTLPDVVIDSANRIHITSVLSDSLDGELKFEKNDLILISFNTDGFLQ